MTMEANELMIGNYVCSPFDEKQEFPFRVDFICADTNVRPIPLTEDWLVKFGFVKEEISYTGYSISIQTHNLKRLFIYEYEGEWAAALIDKYTGKERTELLVVKYNYVHSLQNLFWCLTQTQLIGK